MASKLPYNSMPNLGDLQEGDIVPVLRPPFEEGTATMTDVQKYVRPYKVFVALLTQTTSYPNLTIFQDEIRFDGSSYIATGQFELVFADPFNKSLTTVLIGSCNSISHNKGFIEAFVNDDDNIGIVTYDEGYGLSDDILYNTPIEIRVYYSVAA